MLEYSREALAEFIRVEARTSNGSITSFYGGDQSWFESENGRAGGCGTVAAANILAYFGVVLGADGAFTAAINPGLSRKTDGQAAVGPLQRPTFSPTLGSCLVRMGLLEAPGRSSTADI